MFSSIPHSINGKDLKTKLADGRLDCRNVALLVAQQAHDANQKDLHTIAEVLVEGASKRDEAIMVGHSAKNQTVHFAVPAGWEAEALIGKMVDVRVEEARTWYLRGVCEGEPR